jgi:hypothetical protein
MCVHKFSTAIQLTDQRVTPFIFYKKREGYASLKTPS